MYYKNDMLEILQGIHKKEYKTSIERIAEQIMENSEFVCAFGISSLTNRIIDIFREKGVQFDYLSDNNVKKLISDKTIYEDLKRIAPSELIHLPRNTGFIITCQFGYAIQPQLEKMGFKNIFWINDCYYETIEILEDKVKANHFIKHISNFFDYCTDEESKRVLYHVLKLRISAIRDEYGYSEIYSPNQYFEDEIIKLTEHEVFLDCGAYDGDTVDTFIKKVDSKFDKIYAYEMDEVNYQGMMERFSSYPSVIQDKIVSFKMGVSDNAGEVFYSSNGVGTTIRFNSGDKTAKLGTIDSTVNEQDKVSLICMDVEGAEIEALKGAKRTIQRYRPRLAISIYHKVDDIWEIPEFIKTMLPEYKFFVRHHSKRYDDTVLYAVCD